jgi:L-malate glycosyltransferase
LGLHEHVIYLGTQDAIEQLLGCADLFLLPSSEESFGLAALEAMSCGTPVIASNIGGLPEVIDHGSDGFLFPVGDVDAMAAAAVGLLQDKQKMAQMRAAAREKAESHFRVETLVPEYERYYEQVLRIPH